LIFGLLVLDSETLEARCRLDHLLIRILLGYRWRRNGIGSGFWMCFGVLCNGIGFVAIISSPSDNKQGSLSMDGGM
jgi:hypothetical protein